MYFFKHKKPKDSLFTTLEGKSFNKTAWFSYFLQTKVQFMLVGVNELYLLELDSNGWISKQTRFPCINQYIVHWVALAWPEKQHYELHVNDLFSQEWGVVMALHLLRVLD